MISHEIVEGAVIVFTTISATLAFNRFSGCSIAMLFTLFTGFYLPDLGGVCIHYHLMAFSSMMCIVEFSSGEFRLVKQSENKISWAMAYLFFLGSVIGSLWAFFGLISMELAWILYYLVVLSAQNILMLWGALNGHFNLSGQGWHTNNSGVTDSFFQKK